MSASILFRRCTFLPLVTARLRVLSTTASLAVARTSATAIATAVATAQKHVPDTPVVDRSLIAPWFHELDDMPEERLCLIPATCSSTRSSSSPVAFPPMPIGDTPSSRLSSQAPSSAKTNKARRSLHTLSHPQAPTTPHPSTPTTPYANDDQTLPPVGSLSTDPETIVRDQAQWQETQQAGTACPLDGPTAAAAAAAAADPAVSRPAVADASNPTNAYGKLHPADVGGRGHMGLGENDQAEGPAAWPQDASGRTVTRLPDTETTDGAQEEDFGNKVHDNPTDFVDACSAAGDDGIWPPLASLLLAHQAARFHRVSHAMRWSARGYATKTHAPRVAEIVNPAGTGGHKPRIRPGVHDSVHVPGPHGHVKARVGERSKAFTDVSAGQDMTDDLDRQDGAERVLHKELMAGQ